MSEEMSSDHFDRILVVDDTTANLQLLTNLLTEHGYTVHPASDGELALRFVQSIQPDIILPDVKMPGMDGYEVCRRLKADERTRSIPIIFISILENEHEKVKAFQVGGVDYITKPIRAAEVLARVHTQLSLRHARMDLEARNVDLEAARETLEERVAERSVELEQINRKLQKQIDAHLHTLEALRESEAKYRSLIRKVQTAIVLHDGQGQLLDSNPVAHELLGLSEDQLRGKSLIDPEWHFLREDGSIMPVAEYPVSIVLSSQLALRGYVVGICRPDKDIISWVLVNAEPEYDDSWKVAMVIVSFMDITELRRAEQTLRESEEKFSIAFHSSPNILAIIRIDGTILDVNEGYTRLLGYSRDESLGKTTTELNIWVDPADRITTITALQEYGEITDFETKLRCKDGKLITVIDSARTIKLQGELCTLSIAHDITERREEAEEDIAWNLAINQALSSLYIPLVTTGTSIEQIANIVLEKSRQLTTSAHGYVAEIDPVIGDLIAHTNTKMMQTECKIAEKQLRKIRFPQRADGLYNGLWGHALNTKEPFYTDEPVKHPASVGVPEGHIAIERILAVPVLLAGELVGQIALSNSTRAYTDRDLEAINRIAEFYALAIQHKRAEEKIRKLNQELEQRVADRTAGLEAANKELEAFAYSVSHDLRAPLRHIGGFLELLQKKAGGALDEQSLHYMDTISQAARKMGRLIDDLLSFSRMGRHALLFQPVELGPLVNEVMAELEPDAAGRAIDWCIGDLPTVRGDTPMLRMVLTNLIANALKFTQPRQQAQIEIGSIAGETSEAVIFVRDNGVGFDMAYVDKLFGVFQRLHRAEEFEGTGIGLANVRRIINRHGGRTRAEGKEVN